MDKHAHERCRPCMAGINCCTEEAGPMWQRGALIWIAGVLANIPGDRKCAARGRASRARKAPPAVPPPLRASLE
eukprot:1739115-Alexandrium_andersonii.AAC.1